MLLRCSNYNCYFESYVHQLYITVYMCMSGAFNVEGSRSARLSANSFTCLLLPTPLSKSKLQVCTKHQAPHHGSDSMLSCRSPLLAIIIFSIILSTKCHCQVVTTPALYSGGPRFKSCSRYWLH